MLEEEKHEESMGWFGFFSFPKSSFLVEAQQRLKSDTSLKIVIENVTVNPLPSEPSA